MKVCAYCGGNVGEEALSCPHCSSTTFQVKCRKCGAINDGEFCPRCAAAEEEAERIAEERRKRAAEEERLRAEEERRRAEAVEQANEGLAWKTALAAFLPFVGGYFLLREHVKPGFRVCAGLWCAFFALYMAGSGDTDFGPRFIAVLLCLGPIFSYLFQIRGTIMEDSQEGSKAKAKLAACVLLVAVAIVISISSSHAASKRLAAGTGEQLASSVAASSQQYGGIVAETISLEI